MAFESSSRSVRSDGGGVTAEEGRLGPMRRETSTHSTGGHGAIARCAGGGRSTGFVSIGKSTAGGEPHAERHGGTFDGCSGVGNSVRQKVHP